MERQYGNVQFRKKLEEFQQRDRIVMPSDDFQNRIGWGRGSHAPTITKDVSSRKNKGGPNDKQSLDLGALNDRSGAGGL